MVTKITCCAKCIDKRYPGCHATCQDYKKERAGLDETKRLLALQKEIDYYKTKKGN